MNHSWFLCISAESQKKAKYAFDFLQKKYPDKKFRLIEAKDSLVSFASTGFVVECNSKQTEISVCRIVGADKASGFIFHVAEGELRERCQDIWDHAGDYCKVNDPYNDFLKYLWVEYPDGEERRLCEVIND